MAVIVTPATRHQTQYSFAAAQSNGLKIQVGTLAFDDSYPTGGESLSFNGITDVLFASFTDTAGYYLSYDDSAGKVVVYEAGADGAALDEVGNTTDLSTSLAAVQYLVIGT
jgi:hypothetical protein